MTESKVEGKKKIRKISDISKDVVILHLEDMDDFAQKMSSDLIELGFKGKLLHCETLAEAELALY